MYNSKFSSEIAMKLFTIHLTLLTTVLAQQFPLRNFFDIFNIEKNRQFDKPVYNSKSTSADVTYFVFTKNNPEEGTNINDTNLGEIDPTKNIKYIIHGWTENSKRPWYKQMTDAYLLNFDYNIIQVDWSGPASKRYSVSAGNTRYVGATVGRQIVTLHTEYGIPLENIHILGHSLGGHVAGFAGKEVIKLTEHKIGRITGLDPAGPLFENISVTKDNRLSDEDALMVDIVHTDGGVFGFREKMGTVDFFPNGGVPLQPGCMHLSDLVGILGGSFESVFCSHQKSYKYFTDSILSNKIMATSCESYDAFDKGKCYNPEQIVFGEYCPANATGVYYLKINASAPFAKTAK